MDTSKLTRELGRWRMADEMIERLAEIYMHNRGRILQDHARIGERWVVAAIKERYGVGVSANTLRKWYRTNKEVLDALG